MKQPFYEEDGLELGIRESMAMGLLLKEAFQSEGIRAKSRTLCFLNSQAVAITLLLGIQNQGSYLRPVLLGIRIGRGFELHREGAEWVMSSDVPWLVWPVF